MGRIRRRSRIGGGMASAMRVAVACLVGAVAQAVTVDLQADHGAVGDGVANDQAALSAALADVAGGGVLTIPEGAYRIVGDISVMITGNVSIVGSGDAVLQLDGCYLNLHADAVSTAIASSVERGDTVLRVADDPAIQQGGVLTITCNVDGETAWGYNKQDTHLIASVTPIGGGLMDVILATPLNFDYSPAEPGHSVSVYRNRRLDMNGVDIDITSSGGELRLFGMRGAAVRNMALRRLTGAQAGNGILWHAGVDGAVADLTMADLQYGLRVSNCRNMDVRNVTATNCGHPIVPCNFSDGVSVKGLVGNGCGATMDSHPAFNVHFAEVYANGDTGLSNLRSIGGSIRNSIFNSTSTSGSAYFQSVALVDGSIYGEYEFLVENVEWHAPGNATASAGLGCSYGRRAIFHNVKSRTLLCTVFGQPSAVYISDSEIGRLTVRQPTLNVQSTIFDGDGYSSAGLIGFMGYQYDAVFMDCVFRNADRVMLSDYHHSCKRHFIRCTFEDIDVQWDGMDTYGYAGYNYTYEFDACDFVRVAAYGEEISQSNSEVDADCTFTAGYPVLAPQ